jgi:hypothetical protein
MTKTEHASIRQQQRGIPPMVLDFLIQSGARERSTKGTEIIYFDRKAKKCIESYTGGLIGKLNEHLNAYVVIAEDKVITVGQRYKPIKEFFKHH